MQQRRRTPSLVALLLPATVPTVVRMIMIQLIFDAHSDDNDNGYSYSAGRTLISVLADIPLVGCGTAQGYFQDYRLTSGRCGLLVLVSEAFGV